MRYGLQDNILLIKSGKVLFNYCFIETTSYDSFIRALKTHLGSYEGLVQLAFQTTKDQDIGKIFKNPYF